MHMFLRGFLHLLLFLHLYLHVRADNLFSEIPSSEESYDRHKATELWERSVELVGLQTTETADALLWY
jgi:hypothetical protein